MGIGNTPASPNIELNADGLIKNNLQASSGNDPGFELYSTLSGTKLRTLYHDARGTTVSNPREGATGLGFFSSGLFECGGAPLNADIRLAPGGVISAVNTTIQPISSERRLKENIVAIDADTAWETIKSTPYYTYNFIDSETTSYGPMADEVPAEMVVQPMVDNGDGVKVARADEEGPIRTYDNGMLQARLYTALQTALTRIEALEARLDAAGV
jgi:hypothetical protein